VVHNKGLRTILGWKKEKRKNQQVIILRIVILLFRRYQGRICSCPRRISHKTRHKNCSNKRSWHFQNDKSWLQTFFTVNSFYDKRLQFFCFLRLTTNFLVFLWPFLMSICSVSELESSLITQSCWIRLRLIKEGEGGGVGGDYSRKAFILNQEPITPVSN